VIVKGSRYEPLARRVKTITTAAGSRHAALPLRFVPSTPATFRHVVLESERLDTIAYRYYRNPEKFWLIADANGAVDPQDLLEVGLSILVPPDRGG
jgi:hypothetical protein